MAPPGPETPLQSSQEQSGQLPYVERWLLSPAFSDYLEPFRVNGRFGLALLIVPLVLGVIIVQGFVLSEIERMAKKQKVNKSQAVRDYLRANPKAGPKEIVAALRKKGIKITPGYVAGIKSKGGKRRMAKKARATVENQAAVAEAVTAPVEKKNGDTVTLDQIRAVNEMVKTVGGVGKLNEYLALVKEIGGARKLNALLDAMAIPEGEKIPF